MDQSSRSNRTVVLTGTAILAALVVIFDYALKYSGLKIPFPWMPSLKFDFTGIPIVLSLLLYGLPSAATTSIVAFLAIFTRSGEPVGALMKLVAEFTTVCGIWMGMFIAKRFQVDQKMLIGISLVVGIADRIISMSISNLIVLPSYYGYRYEIAVGMLPLIAVFNALQGSLTILMGWFLFNAYKKRTSINIKN